jgi:hypothetical protein
MKTSMQYPNTVMVIRHGEKLGDPNKDDQEGGPDLSMLGSARAAALPSLFTSDPQTTPSNGMQQLSCDLSASMNSQFTGSYGSHNLPAEKSPFKTPDFVFATKADTNSNRPMETVTPLQQALRCFNNNPQFTINSDFPDPRDGHNGVKGLTKEILNNPIYASKVILICWHHGKIPKLVEKLGVDAKQLPWPDWPANIFDLIFCITWADGKATLKVETQRLLHGDVDKYP